MSHLHPRAKIALGFACLTLSMSVTFFNPPPLRSTGIMLSPASLAEVRRIHEVNEYRREENARLSEESERLLREVTALHEDLARMDRIEPSVSSPAE